jgi:GAF domain-containing protein
MAKEGLMAKLKKTAVLDDGILAISSLSRALGGDARLSDVGSLLWVLLRQVVPCDSVALFMPDTVRDQVVVRYAAGAHANVLHGITRPRSTGIAGWVAVNRRPILNAEPVFDLGFRVTSAPALRSSLVVPLIDGDALIAVMALYSKDLLAFTEEHADMLDVLGTRLARTLGEAVLEDDEVSYGSETPVLRLVGKSC